MPQEPVEPYKPLASDYRWRVTATYADDAIPPQIPGAVASEQEFTDPDLADQQIEVASAATNIGRIVLEERLTADTEEGQEGWHATHSWTRTAEGWQHQ